MMIVLRLHVSQVKERSSKFISFLSRCESKINEKIATYFTNIFSSLGVLLVLTNFNILNLDYGWDS